MNATETKSFSEMETQQERADWLLSKGVTATLSIDPDKLAPAYQAEAAGVILPDYFATETEAVEKSIEWLQGFQNQLVSHACDHEEN